MSMPTATDIGNAIHTLIAAGYTVGANDGNLCFALHDEATGEDTMGVINTKSGLGLGIHIKGYGDCCSDDDMGQPIYIEKYDGQLMVRVYGDINSDSPTHTINLEGARLDKRVTEEEQG
ncbi:hypothetical protein [Alteromonas oceanisediminis]|uniref:hypothetical protein n=1 Tax=Alteromonas oceanisediminis TaxID=2836180 RepID=UPI001BD93C5B|nr:hypothetical protein [Alteromonas oceanisediminis]MBT0587972.1 hypothetical protein [Alteromonas oceanisediminis]